MTKNSRIKFIIITAVTVIFIMFAVLVFQLVKIFQYNSRLEKLEKEIKKNNEIIKYYENQPTDKTLDEEIGVQ